MSYLEIDEDFDLEIHEDPYNEAHLSRDISSESALILEVDSVYRGLRYTGIW